MKNFYFESVIMIERLHRLFLEVIKAELDRIGVRDINNVQCLVLYNIGTEEVTVGELTNRGYYLGSNVSYNLRKMVQNQYLIQEPSSHDRRSSHVKLSKKGLDLFKKFDGTLELHSVHLAKSNVSLQDIKGMVKTLGNIEAFWTGLITKDLRKL
ncbi:MAG: MarR family transcriptional regulator [Alphaproteobacteria bacterium]